MGQEAPLDQELAHTDKFLKLVAATEQFSKLREKEITPDQREYLKLIVAVAEKFKFAVNPIVTNDGTPIALFREVLQRADSLEKALEASDLSFVISDDTYQTIGVISPYGIFRFVPSSETVPEGSGTEVDFAKNISSAFQKGSINLLNLSRTFESTPDQARGHRYTFTGNQTLPDESTTFAILKDDLPDASMLLFASNLASSNAHFAVISKAIENQGASSVSILTAGLKTI